MRVYGDHGRRCEPHGVLEEIETRWQVTRGAPNGLSHHAEWVSLLIEAGELAQALLDYEAERCGHDEVSVLERAAMALVFRLAQTVARSHASGHRTLGPLDPLALETLKRLVPRQPLWTKVPEGYAYYALYPELYLEAAAAMKDCRPLCTLGIRSIGTSLSCLVAAAANAQSAPWTVRPVGDPFRRTLRIGPRLQKLLHAAGAESHFAIVDEGPGLSGSSFQSVADCLGQSGVPPDRIHFFPSHLGPLGPCAAAKWRNSWENAQRHQVGFDERFVSSGSSYLLGWAADLLGTGPAAAADLSGGAWRSRIYPSENRWPAVDSQKERRKFLVETTEGRWLLKFAGLGRYGESALARARTLGERGFTPEVAGLRYGFLVQRWVEARPLPLVEFPRALLISHLASYLSFLHQRFEASPSEGATVQALFEMAWVNSKEALGEGACLGLERFRPALERLERDARRVRTDNRMHAWEWLLLPSGQLLKTDALDHHAAHDLVGAQDIAWDLSGAAVELGLSEAERAELESRLAHACGRRFDPEERHFYDACYLAFQLGSHTLSAMALEATLPNEASRLKRAAAHYASRLKYALQCS